VAAIGLVLEAVDLDGVDADALVLPSAASASRTSPVHAEMIFASSRAPGRTDELW
jgi:hypothetical protein